jgi:hypothetical protein
MPEVEEKAGPDWEEIQCAVECPLCEYNLRGLSVARCPECGLEFDWGEVLDPKRQRHPYLFEHHPERSWNAFFRTLIGGLRPGKFWTTLHPAQPSSLSRLLMYGGIVLGIALLPLVASRVLLAPWPTRFIWGSTLRLELAYEYLPDFFLMVFRPLFRLPVVRLLPVIVIWWTMLPVGTYLLLLIFQGTMRRGRVKAHHVLRCIIYSADALIWPSLVLLVLLPLNLPAFRLAPTELIAWVLLVSLPIVWMRMAWRLMVAYRRYLRFPHAEGVIASVQVILLLVWMILLFKIRF